MLGSREPEILRADIWRGGVGGCLRIVLGLPHPHARAGSPLSLLG